MNSMICVRCDKVLESAFSNEEILQPYGATSFTASGHYGSTAFDPMNGEALELFVCDPCLLIMAENSKIHHHGRSKEMGLWAPDQETIDWVTEQSKKG